MERLLVSTALEESWDHNQPVLFLGEWCRLYSRHDRWSELDAIVLPYHWDDGEKLERDRRFLESLYEELLVDISEKLNDLHGTDHSLRYWRILIGPWLGYFTQTLFDRWASVDQAVTNHRLSGTIVLSGLRDGRVPQDMRDFFYLENSHGWDHHLFGRILTNFTNVQCVRRPTAGFEHETHSGLSEVTSRPVRAFNLKVGLVSALSKLSNRFVRPTDYFVINTCLRSLRDELTLQYRLGQVPCFVPVESPKPVPIDERSRNWSLGGNEWSGFAACLRNLIPEQMPAAYLEGYQALCDESDRRRWPRSPRVIFTGGSHYYDDVFKAWCGARVEEGAPLVVAQHGGHVGIAWSFDHDHQLAIADQFLSWGWSDPAEPKVIPFGMLKAPILPEADETKRESVLLVTNNTGQHCSTIGRKALSSQILGYLEDQFNFVESLSPLVQDSLVVRLSKHPNGLMWEHELRWRDRCPSVAIDDGNRPILDLITEAKLCVSTSNGTTFLETLFMDIPTVLFWDTSVWEIVESAVPFFSALAEVGIFHDNPQSAAKHVSSVWNDVPAWWSSDPVVDAVAAFKRNYCEDPGDVLEELKSALITYAREVPRQ